LPRYWNRWDSWKCGNAVHTSNIGIQTAEARLCRGIKGRDISPILLRQIAKDIGLTIDEFLKKKQEANGNPL